MSSIAEQKPTNDRIAAPFAVTRATSGAHRGNVPGDAPQALLFGVERRRLGIRLQFVTAVGAFLTGVLPFDSARGQIADQVIAWGVADYSVQVHRYSRRLELLGSTEIFQEGVGGAYQDATFTVDANGRYWIPYGPLYASKLVRIASDGQLLPSVVLGHNPVALTGSKDGTVYALTRIPLNSPAPLYSVHPDGAIQWVNNEGPGGYIKIYPAFIAKTATGELWMAGTFHGACACDYGNPVLKRIDPQDGSVMAEISLPKFGPQATTGPAAIGVSPDGSLWIRVVGLVVGASPRLYQVLNGVVVRDFPTPGAGGHIQASPSGALYQAVTPSGGIPASRLARISQLDGSIQAQYDLGGGIKGFTLSPTAEEAFAVIGVGGTNPFRLARVNLVTGVISSIGTTANLVNHFPGGDSMGYVRASVHDRLTDADGDGAPNGVEVEAGSHPYLFESRPDGPKVYLSFTTSKAIVLRYVDLDGLLHPSKGIDPASLRFEVEGYGDILPLLWSFLTSVSATPDGKEATLTFGALPLPSNLALRLEARVQDKTGAVGWDWQISPPGMK